MANHHLRNNTLRLKAKGLLSLMLSLPDNWDYTLKGLARLCADGIDAISETVKELERAGYVKRERIRNSKGHLKEIIYNIYETPRIATPSDQLGPDPAKPVLAKPERGNPVLVKPVLVNPTQLNTKKENTKKQNTVDANINPSSINHPDQMRLDPFEVRQQIKTNIEYDFLLVRQKKELLDEILELIVETITCGKESFLIAGTELPADLVTARFSSLRQEHIEYVLECIANNSTKIRNIKNYLLTSLYNAPATINSYYAALVNHELNNPSRF